MWTWLFVTPWLVFLAWWIVRAPSTAKTESRETMVASLGYRIFFIAGTALLLLDRGHQLGLLSKRLWPPSLVLALVGLALTFAGVAFAIWARETLGRLWSGTITLKEGHRVIMTGPYALARHPIYTGLIVGLVGTALARRDIASFLGVLLLAIGIALKLRREEKLMTETFGAEYGAYKQRVKAIIPFIL